MTTPTHPSLNANSNRGNNTARASQGTVLDDRRYKTGDATTVHTENGWKMSAQPQIVSSAKRLPRLTACCWGLAPVSTMYTTCPCISGRLYLGGKLPDCWQAVKAYAPPTLALPHQSSRFGCPGYPQSLATKASFRSPSAFCVMYFVLRTLTPPVQTGQYAQSSRTPSLMPRLRCKCRPFFDSPVCCVYIRVKRRTRNIGEEGNVCKRDGIVRPCFELIQVLE